MLRAAALVLAAALAARAADVALVIGNADYARQPDLPEAARVTDAAVARNAKLEEQARRRQPEQERADNAFWSQSGAGGSESGLRRYLVEYPDGLHADEARDTAFPARARPAGDRLP